MQVILGVCGGRNPINIKMFIAICTSVIAHRFNCENNNNNNNIIYQEFLARHLGLPCHLFHKVHLACHIKIMGIIIEGVCGIRP